MMTTEAKQAAVEELTQFLKARNCTLLTTDYTGALQYWKYRCEQCGTIHSELRGKIFYKSKICKCRKPEPQPLPPKPDDPKITGQEWDRVAKFLDEHGYRMVKRQRDRGPNRTMEEVAAFLKKQGCTLITKRFVDDKQPLHYQCDKCGHHSVAPWNNIYRMKRYCRKCWLNSKATGQYAGGGGRIVLREKLFNIVEAARWLGVRYDDFYKHVRYSGLLPAPTRKATATGLNRLYSEADLKKIKKMIKVES